MIDTERGLFEGRLGTEWVRVWLDYRAGSIVLASHDIGPGLELVFGRDEIETYLEVDAVHLPNLTAALRAERTDPDAPMDAIELLAARYRGDSTATTGIGPGSQRAASHIGSSTSDTTPVRRLACGPWPPSRTSAKATRSGGSPLW